ncbi:MAG TPA: cytochrome c oxidase subunit I [Vicinamibacterales bacterium]|jgi:cytochrome c oxidase subunit 1|nr:cytochrome c oxidase subunit I [Vicinamibacterales bacterium]
MDTITTTTGLNYLNNGYGLKSWLLTRDHKRIALLYLWSVTAFFALGGFFALLIRLELLTPAADLVQPETYNKLFTMHGVIMVFFFLIPSIPATLGNFLIPIMVGAKDLAFPRINLLSWYIYILGGVFTLVAAMTGGIDTGWTFYVPYSTAASNSHVILAGLGIFITGFSSILTGLNFIVTVHRMRAPGLTWFRLPLFVWSHYATSLIMILGTPVIAITVLLVAVERGLHLGIFDPALGGDPILFQHLFWFYSHPAVYIMILPAMGVISEIVQAFTRKNVFGYAFVAFSSLAIAIIGFLVWGHHLFIAGQSTYAGLVFSILSMLVAIPSAVKVFNWTATIYKGSVSYESPMLYVFGFIGLFTIGGLTGLFLATMGLDVHVHDTYFVIAHFHYVMVGGAIMGYLGGIHYWWPKITGRMYPEGWAKFAALVVFVGFNLTFFPQFIVGYLGMPRRYAMYPQEFQVYNVLSTAGASVLGVGYLIPIIYLIWSLKHSPLAGQNPWGAKGLEWEIPSPPPTENFAVTPVVTQGTHQYAPSREVGIAH